MKIFFYIIFTFVFSFQVSSKPVLSGINQVTNNPRFFEENEFISYGRIVTGVINWNSKYENTTGFDKETYIYFCNFDSLHQVYSKSTNYDSSSKYESSRETSSSEDVYPVSIPGDHTMDGYRGLTGFVKRIKTKCTNTYTKPPRYEIPISYNDSMVTHAILDTTKLNTPFRTIWIKSRPMSVDFYRNSDGSKLLLDGKEWKKYTIIQTKGYEMMEIIIDCKKDKIFIPSLVEYDSNGIVLKNSQVKFQDNQMDNIVPNSLGENVQNFLCKI